MKLYIFLQYLLLSIFYIYEILILVVNIAFWMIVAYNGIYWYLRLLIKFCFGGSFTPTPGINIPKESRMFWWKSHFKPPPHFLSKPHHISESLPNDDSLPRDAQDYFHK